MADSTARQKDRQPAPARPRANKPQTEYTTVRIRPCNTSQISRRRAWSKSSVPGIVLQFQTTHHRNGDLGVKQHVRIVQFRMKDVTERVNERERAAFRKGMAERELYDRIGRQRVIHTPQEYIEPLTGDGRN